MEFNFHAAINNLEGLLFLFLLASMVYCGAVYTMKRSGLWPRLFLGGAAGTFAAFAVLLIGVVVGVVSLATSSALTPNVPVTYETWDLLGSLAKAVFGASFLLAGIALVFIGANEGKRGTRRKRKK